MLNNEKISQINNKEKYLEIAPDYIIEIDTKADLDSPGATIDYFDRKNQQLLAFGVKKIIWIFTDAQIVKVILPGEETQTFAWEEDVPVMDGIHFNLQKIMDQLKAE
jgi:Uma2 family endonuclease